MTSGVKSPYVTMNHLSILLSFLCLSLIPTFLFASSVEEVRSASHVGYYSRGEFDGKLKGQTLDSTPASVSRYIDYENGDDNNAGTRNAPWKHHPWDANAEARAKSAQGISTYIFKKGVIYRGFLKASESGVPEAPITLTVDPNWGEGDATLAGSTRYTSAWQPCSEAVSGALPGPSRTLVWCLEISAEEEPRVIWDVGEGDIARIRLARSPNWGIVDGDDPRSQWYESEDVLMELEVTVANAGKFSVGDSLSISPTENASFSGRMKAFSIGKIIGIKRSTLRLELRESEGSKVKPGMFVSSGQAGTEIRGVGSTHSIIRRLRDTKNLMATRDDAYVGATVWAERRNMPKPDAALVIGSSSEERSLSANFHRAAGAGPMQYDRYYLEGLPDFLDAAGEFVFRNIDNDTGVLMLRLQEDRDPNEATLEVAQLPVILQISNQSNIAISGLSFRYTNQIAPGSSQARHASLYASPIQIRGDASNIAVSNCDFSYLTAGVVAFPEERDAPSRIDHITVRDSIFTEIDGSPIVMGNGQSHYKLKSNGSRLIHVNVLGNTLENVGYRVLGHFGVGSHGDGIQVMGGEVVEVAGNQIKQVWGSGISVTVGSEYKYGEVPRPFLRSLIHHNTVIDSVLGAQDGGGINSWMGGPSYIFNNISGNPVGCIHSREKTSAKQGWYRRGCFGVGIYLDGQYKGYVFNNIVWGKNNDVNDRIYNSVGINEAMGFMNTIFGNTIYRFATGLHKGMWQHNRNYYLSNLFMNMGLGYIEQEPLANTIDYSTLAFANNQFFGKTEWFGKLGIGSSSRYADIESWIIAMRSAGLLQSDTGSILFDNPVIDAEAHDFRPAKNSSVVDKGAKVFVPWALYDVVGEWHFLRRNQRPRIIDGANINMDERWVERDMFHFIPRNDLLCVNTGRSDFEEGLLENWIVGALRFDGDTRYCKLSTATTLGDRANSGTTHAVKDSHGVDMANNSFLIEIVVAPEAGAGSYGLVEKLDSRGYSLRINTMGLVEFVLKYGDDASRRISSLPVNDGLWHHILVEVDRNESEGIRIFIDGQSADGEWQGVPMKRSSVSNESTFFVGRSDTGAFAGKMDFLRVARGTLEQAETNIAELYLWQFSGPHLHDFYGRVNNGLRDVGAVDFFPE